MTCPQCGCFMTRLVECHKAMELGPNDELVEKQTAIFYQQCQRHTCLHTETVGIEVAETTLPYYAVLSEA